MGHNWCKHQDESDQSKVEEIFNCMWHPFHDYLISSWNDNIYQIHYISDEPFVYSKIWSDTIVTTADKLPGCNHVRLLDTNIYKELVAICNVPGDVKILNKIGLNSLETPHNHLLYISVLKFNPFGTLLFAADLYGAMCMWDMETNKLTEVNNLGITISDMSWRNDSQYAIAGDEYDIFVYEYNITSKCILRLTGHWGYVTGIKWNDTADYLASRSLDMTVKIWNFNTISVVTQHSHTNHITDIKWFRTLLEGKLILASASFDKTIILSYAEENICIYIPMPEPIYVMDFNVTGEYLAVGGSNHIIIVETKKMTSYMKFKTEDSILKLTWNKTGDKLAACIENNNIMVFNINTRTSIGFK